MRYTNDPHFCRDTSEFVNITEQMKLTLSHQFPGVDVDRELDKMREWLLTNTRGKTYKGGLDFVRKWLARAFASPIKPLDVANSEPSYIPDAMEGYLKDLWKDNKHLLDRNTKTSSST